MKLNNLKVYDFAECIIASGYPMVVNTEDFEKNVKLLEKYKDDERIKNKKQNLPITFINKEEEDEFNIVYDHMKRIMGLGSTDRGSGHDQALTGIRVSFDLTFTNKAWVEMERYRFVEFVSSQSTMHRISKFDLKNSYNKYVDKRIIDIMEELKDKYNETQDIEDYLKLLYSNPAGFELTARLTTNYRALKTVYLQRYNHRLPEWREFCKELLKLPYFVEICGITVFPK